MKKILSLLMGSALLVSVQAVRADDMGKMNMSTPTTSSTPMPKQKVKKTKKKAAKKTDAQTQAVWVCPMGDYSGPKTKDGKCPKCGMDLVEKK
jgi:hypothetical protein